MRIFSLLALIPLFASSLASALILVDDAIPGELRGWKQENAPSKIKRVKAMTNAQRFAQGLPPLPPTKGDLFSFIFDSF